MVTQWAANPTLARSLSSDQWWTWSRRWGFAAHDQCIPCGGKGLKGLRVQGDILGLLSLDSHLVVLLKPG